MCLHITLTRCKVLEHSIVSSLFTFLTSLILLLLTIKNKMDVFSLSVSLCVCILYFNTNCLSLCQPKTPMCTGFSYLFLHTYKLLAVIFTDTRWFKYDREYLCVNKSQFVPVIFEPPCTFPNDGLSFHSTHPQSCSF
jgi:hypothetical protein